MIVSCNNTIKEIHYNGHIIQKVYGCSGELVYEATPTPPITTDKVEYILFGVTHSIPCNSSSTLTKKEIENDLEKLTYKRDITSVVIGDCVTSIQYYTFNSCSGLTSCTIPNSVTSIGEGAFAICPSLTSVTIPSGVTSISNTVFQQCSGLTSIDIPSGVTSIGNQAFYYCTSLTNIDIPNSVTSIGGDAFNSCHGLSSVTIGSGVTSIGEGAFCYCPSLTSVTIPSGVTSIGTYAFQSCTSLTSITCNAVTPPTLGSYAFGGTNCPIYVPSESLSTYQTTSGWSTYASRIQAIP